MRVRRPRRGERVVSVIVAKYASTCRVCDRRIPAGERIEWTRDAGSRHVTCGSTTSSVKNTKKAGSPSHPRGHAISYPTSAPVEGAHEISGRRDGRGDRRYDVGQIIYAPKVALPGGGPDRHYYTVLACRLVPPNEDMGHYDWTEYAWVRAATDEEAAGKATERRAADAPRVVAEFVLAVLCSGEQLSEDAAASPFPSAEEIAATWNCKTSSARVQHVVLCADGHVVGRHGGHYDDYRPSAWTHPGSSLLAIAIRALAGGDAAALAVAADAVREALPPGSVEGKKS